MTAVRLVNVGMVLGCLLMSARGGEEKKPDAPKAAPVPRYEPAKQPVVIGEFLVGVVIVTFKDTEAPGGLLAGMERLDLVTGTHEEADPSVVIKPKTPSAGTGQEEYFKIYSNNIAWPKLAVMPAANVAYKDPHFYGYYCEYEYWENPIGWKTREEGDERVEKMNQAALRFGNKSYSGSTPRFICYNYVTTRVATPDQALSDELNGFYRNRGAEKGRVRKARKARKARKGEDLPAEKFQAWEAYTPKCAYGDPLWPNSKIQLHDFSGGTLAHEIGHCLGAPDVYRLGRFNDGIGGGAALLSYGPTANSFSRFYHHAYIKEANHPVIKSSGSYTLHPRHIEPKKDEAVGYLIPSSHPHYMYHVEYVHKENATVGVGPEYEGMLVSVINFGLSNYLGSPDYYYVYRPNDPFFRGLGATEDCLFGKAHKRTELTMTTEPSVRLPNLLDGGVRFKNIAENDGTLTFEVTVERQPLSGAAYAQSMLPQIRLDEVSDVQPTSFTMDSTIKFRGEPLKTFYGFCWSTAKNPTVRDSVYTLAHRECYRGHAINLTPDTTYYLRAFATNGLGVRYSDEEKVVKTPKLPGARIGPLVTDLFSENEYLFTAFSSEGSESSESFVGYSPTCVLAKLLAYYRPARFPAAVDADEKPADVDFNRLSWNPGYEDNLMRLEEINGFFQSVYDQGRKWELHDPRPGKSFLSNLAKATGLRSKPVLSTLSAENHSEIAALIRSDLEQSRPVIVVFSYDGSGGNLPVRWALIDGINEKGEFHVDFPRNSKFQINGDWQAAKSGYRKPEDLLVPVYKTLVVTSCFFAK